MELLCFCFHRGESSVIVGELIKMCERNFTRTQRVIVGHVGGRVSRTMLELNFETQSELLDVELRPVNAEGRANPPGLFNGETLGFTHSRLFFQVQSSHHPANLLRAIHNDCKVGDH